MSDQPKLNISLDKTTGVTCEKCGGMVFQEGIILRKASRFLTGTAQDALIPIPVFNCAACGHVNEEFIPSQLKKQPEQPDETETEQPKPKPGGLTVVR